MAALDVMRRYLEAVQRGDWETGFGFFADDIVLHLLASEERVARRREGAPRAAADPAGQPLQPGRRNAAIRVCHPLSDVTA